MQEPSLNLEYRGTNSIKYPTTLYQVIDNPEYHYPGQVIEVGVGNVILGGQLVPGDEGTKWTSSTFKVFDPREYRYCREVTMLYTPHVFWDMYRIQQNEMGGENSVLSTPHSTWKKISKSAERHQDSVVLETQQSEPNKIMISCPFCAEEIQEKAKKCKHCGEWLEQSKNRLGGSSINRGTADARAVAKGIKQQKAEEEACGCLGFIVIITAIAVGVTVGWLPGVIIFFTGIALISTWYNKE